MNILKLGWVLEWDHIFNQAEKNNLDQWLVEGEDDSCSPEITLESGYSLEEDKTSNITRVEVNFYDPKSMNIEYADINVNKVWFEKIFEPDRMYLRQETYTQYV